MSMGPGKSNFIRTYMARALTCGECDFGLVPVEGCTCSSAGGPESPHERYCGWEPCPNGCWWRLNPGAPGATSDTIVQLWIEDPKSASLKHLARGFPLGQWSDGKICQASPGGRRKIFGHVRCWMRLRVTRNEWRLYWSAGQEGHCAVWYYETPWGALWGARQLHHDRTTRAITWKPGRG